MPLRCPIVRTIRKIILYSVVVHNGAVSDRQWFVFAYVTIGVK